MDPRKMMGFQIPGDERVRISVREWNAVKLAIWRSAIGWEIAVRQAAEILDRCEHVDGCPAVLDERSPCARECPDREQRMSALVILNAARQFAPVDARKAANEPYFAPSREYFSEVLATLVAANAELEALRARVGAPSTPPSNQEDALPLRPVPLLLQETTEDETRP